MARPASTKLGAKRDLLLLGVFVFAAWGVSFAYGLFDLVFFWTRAYEHWEVDEVFAGLILSFFALSLFATRRWHELKKEIGQRLRLEEALHAAQKELEQRVRDRTATLERLNAQLETEIAERKAIEDALRSSEQRLRMMVEHLPAGAVYHEGNIFITNNPVERLTGHTKDDLSSLEQWFATLYGEEADAMRALYERDRTAGFPEPRIMPLTRKDGQRRMVEFAAYEADGKEVWLLYDVTERYEAEEALRESERRYRALIENSLGLICSHDLSGVLLSVNPAAAHLLGYAPVEMEGKNLAEFLAPAARPFFPQYLENIRANRIDRGVLHILTKTGEARFLAYHNTLYEETGKPPYILGHAQDVTDQKRAEWALRASEERFRTLIDNSLDIVTILDRRGLAQYQNPSIAKVLGYSQEALIGQSVLAYIHPDDVAHVEAVIAEIVEHPGTIKSVELRFRHRNGSWRVLEALATALPDSPLTTTILVNSRDITERKEVQMALTRAKEAAEAANRAKSEFLAAISHELRTPLNIILGYADLLREGVLGALTHEQLDAVERLHKSGGELLELITAVLNLTQLDFGRVSTAYQAVSISALLHDLDLETRDLQVRSDLTFVWLMSEELPLVETDPGTTKLVLKNLLTNAIKFTKQGSVTISAVSRAGGVEISVSDTGIGIPAEGLALIFEPFRQLDSSATRQYGGVGLGLHIAKRLLDLLGGEITVESQVGRGSTFRVWLPAAAPKAETTAEL